MDNKYTPVGTKLSGYIGQQKESFECEHCMHFDKKNKASSKGLCCHPVVLADSQVPKYNGNAIVDEHGCCTYWRGCE